LDIMEPPRAEVAEALDIMEPLRAEVVTGPLQDVVEEVAVVDAGSIF